MTISATKKLKILIEKQNELKGLQLLKKKIKNTISLLENNKKDNG
jgi:flagellar biosynthesis chaperone FliJ